MKSKFVIIYFIGFLFGINCQAQLTDLARIDYTFVPDITSGIEYSRARAMINYPIKLKKKDNYLLLGLDYSNIHLRINRTDFPFDKSLINDFQSLDFSIGFTKPVKNNWRFAIRVKPGFSTNLIAKSISFEDVVISGDIIFVKNQEKSEENKYPYRLILGVSYSENRGIPFPLPFVSYSKKFHEKWSFNLGVPKTDLQFHISHKQRIKLYAELDGFTANLQNGVLLNDNTTAETINMSVIIGGLQYEYYVTEHLQIYTRSAYIFSNNASLKDKNHDRIYTLDNKPSLYLRTGIRFKL